MNEILTLPAIARAATIAVVLLLGACQSKVDQTAVDPALPAPPVDTLSNAVPGTAENEYWGLSNVVFFETDSSTLTTDAQTVLNEQARYLTDYPALVITVEGHADERGTRDYNLGLGERRANATASYLVALGIAATRISIISYGKERPACPEATDACWAQNRRTVTAVNSN